MKSERFNEPIEMVRNLKVFDENSTSGGPIVLNYRGKNYVPLNDEAHILVDGRTGCGKTSTCSIPYVISGLLSHQSIIAIDPKGDLYENTAFLAEKTHNVKVFNFREPRASGMNKWNPLYSAYSYYKNGNPELVDEAYEMITDMAQNIYPVNNNLDPFWPQSASEFFMGIVLGLFEVANSEEINIDSVANVMIQAENKLANTTFIKEFAESFPEDSMVRRYLNTYVSSPNDTRSSIHSVASNGISIFARSRGLMEMLSQDTIDINNLDVDEKPLAIYIILPEKSVYAPLAALLFSQLTNHFLRLAHKKYNGKLPHKMNLILEELSSIGEALPSLCELMVAGRSRNIRLMLVLQNGISQLKTLYGESRSSTILSCIGTTFSFSTNNWETLKETSERCGYKNVEVNGQMEKQFLISAPQLAAMETRQCLVFIDNRYKYITKLPFYNRMFDMSDWHPPKTKTAKTKEVVIKTFNLKKYVEDFREERISKMLNSPPTNPFSPPFPLSPSSDFDVDELVKRIDKKIEELESESEDTTDRFENSNEHSDGKKELEILHNGIPVGDSPSITILRIPKRAYNEVVKLYSKNKGISIAEAKQEIRVKRERLVLKYETFFEMMEAHEVLMKLGVRCLIDE